MSVKSESPRCPGTWSWRKITSRSAPCSARQARTRSLQAATKPVPVVIGMAALHLLQERDRP